MSAQAWISPGIYLLITIGIYVIARKIYYDDTRKRFFVWCYRVVIFPVAFMMFGVILDFAGGLFTGQGMNSEASMIPIVSVQILSLTAPPVIFAHIAYIFYARTL
jgi:hypothetical protein